MDFKGFDMDLFIEDLDMDVECGAVPIGHSVPLTLHLEQTLAVSDTHVTPTPSDLSKVREDVTELINISLLEYDKQLKEVLENMKESIKADLLLREQARNKEVEGRRDRIRKGTLELDGWLKSWVTKWLSKVKKPSDKVSEVHCVNGKRHCEMRHELRKTLGLMEFRNQKDMYMRHMKASDDEKIFQKNTEEHIKTLETAYKDLTADISMRLEDTWATFNIPKIHRDTSGGPQDETTPPQTSSKPTVCTTSTPKETKGTLDPLNEPQPDLKKARRLLPIIKICKTPKKLMKIKSRDKVCVMPVIQQNECGDETADEVQADKEQAERKLQERIKMFQVKTKVEEKKSQRKWTRIFRWFLPKHRYTC